MNKSKITMMSLEELVVETVRLGRELEALVREAYFEEDCSKHLELQRGLRNLAGRNPFEGICDKDLTVLRDILDRVAAREIVGNDQKFVETGSDTDGICGEYREYPVYSERGNKLSQAMVVLDSFLATRSAALDRAAAEKIASKLCGA